MNGLDNSVHPISVPTSDIIAERLGADSGRNLVLNNVEQTIAAGIRYLIDDPGQDDHQMLPTESNCTKVLIVEQTERFGIEQECVGEDIYDDDATHLGFNDLDQLAPVGRILIQQGLGNARAVDPYRPPAFLAVSKTLSGKRSEHRPASFGPPQGNSDQRPNDDIHHQ